MRVIMSQWRALTAIIVLGAVAPHEASGQTQLGVRLRYGVSASTEARGGDVALGNPALAALGDQARSSASFLGVAGLPRASRGILRGLVGEAWGKRDENLSRGTTKGLLDFGRIGDTPSPTEVQWLGVHSGTMAINVQTSAIGRGRWDERTRFALRGDPRGLGVPGVIDEGSSTDLAVVTTASMAFGQGNGRLGAPATWWSGLTLQGSYVHMREQQEGRAITVASLRNEGSRLDLDGVGDDARATRLDRLRLEGGWIWSAGLGGIWKVGRGTVLGIHGAHLVQLNRSRGADAFVGQTTFLRRDARGLQVERVTDRLTADSSESLRVAANDLADEQRWTPTANVTLSTDFNGPIRRLSVGAIIPFDTDPSLDRQRREVGGSVMFAAGWLPRVHYTDNDKLGSLFALAWNVGTCSIRLDAGGGKREAGVGEAEWMGQVRITILSRECRKYRPDA